MYNKTDKLS